MNRCMSKLRLEGLGGSPAEKFVTQKTEKSRKILSGEYENVFLQTPHSESLNSKNRSIADWRVLIISTIRTLDVCDQLQALVKLPPDFWLIRTLKKFGGNTKRNS